MVKPVLVIMAAGMGSRYGGLKQIDPIDEYGNIIMDYSIFDAVEAGFEKVIFIIKKENEKDFREVIGNRIEKRIKVEYVYQALEDIPVGYTVPEGRVKPFGTGHAVLSCYSSIDGPFAVINADDYYGKKAFQMIYDYLMNHSDDEMYRYTMVGYELGNTLSDSGHVARGICTIDEKGYLTGIQERTQIERKDGSVAFTEDDGASWTALSMDTYVSMNMWGFNHSMLQELKDRFTKFLDENLDKNPLKCEYFLPSVVEELLQEQKATVKVLPSKDKWYGVTYKEDKEKVISAMKELKKFGFYKETVWED